MTKITRMLTIGGLIIISLLVYLIAAVNKPKEESFGGAPIGSECKALQFTGAIATSTLIQAGETTLCGVCVTEDQVGAVVLHDATSTAAVTQGTYNKRIIDFQSAFAEGCYEINAFAKQGLVMVSDDGFSFAGDWTILYR